MPLNPWPLLLDHCLPNPTPPPLGQPSRPEALQCFSCGKPGHRKTACPKIGRHTLLVNGIELEGFDDVIADDDVPEEDVLEEQVHGDTGTLPILRHSCFAPKQLDDSWLQKNFFRSTCTVNGKV